VSSIWTPAGEYRPPDESRSEAQPPPDVELTPEQLAAEIRKLRVSDVLLSTMSTVAQLGFAKLEPGSRDLDQARVAIEALRALLPVMQPFLPAEAHRDFAQVVANLQLAYASAADAESAGPTAGATRRDAGG